MLKIFIFLCLICFTSTRLNSAAPFAIIGGQDDGSTNPYVAFVDPSGSTTALSGDATPTGTGSIDAVAMNSSGNAIIGGRDNGSSDPYIALVDSNGVTTALSGAALPQGTGGISAVAINASGNAIIGGRDNGSNDAYMALVSSTGETTAITGPALPTGSSGSIGTVAINASGNAIIGGRQFTNSVAYAALVSSDGVTSPLTGAYLPSGLGLISSVSINDSGNAICGGSAGALVYVALISPIGETTPLTGAATPVGNGNMNAVAINSSGNAIIGGRDNGFNDTYVALVATNGETTALTGSAAPQGTGNILDVAINSSGAGIICGYDVAGAAYAALVAPNGVTTALTGASIPQGTGFIRSAAINDSGSAIIGGNDNGSTSPYVALVAPNGQTTALSGAVLPQGNGVIYGVAIIDAVTTGLAETIDPQSYGPGNIFGDALFALSTSVLQNHLTNSLNTKVNKEILGVIAYLLDPRSEEPCAKQQKETPYSIWLAPFGIYDHYKQQGTFPALNDWGVGAIVGFDYLGWRDLIFGGGFAYAYQDVGYDNNLGDSRINQELLTCYLAWNAKKVLVQAALWGGIYQMRNNRNTLGVATSSSNVNGGLLNPHLSVSVPLIIKETFVKKYNCRLKNSFSVEPFAMVDWMNNWQRKVQEEGSSGLNLQINQHHVSLLRSEGGIYFLYSIGMRRGKLSLAESLSCVNITPFNTQTVSVYYVGSISPFDIQLFNNETQNLGALRFTIGFAPWNQNIPEFSLAYQGEFGPKAFYNAFSLEFGWKF